MPQILCAKQDGNWTTAATWAVCNAGTLVDSEAASFQLTTTSNFDSPTMTPGAITIDGIGLKSYMNAYNGSHVLNVILRNTSDSTDVVTVAVTHADIGARGWFLVKFDAVLLEAAKNYVIRLQSDNTNQFRFHGPAGTNNYSRFLRTTTASAAAPAAGDKVLICGEVTGSGARTARTVTMDNTDTSVSLRPISAGTWSTALGLGSGGTLSWSTAESQALYLAFRGLLSIGDMSAMLIGTEATPLPNTSTAHLLMDSAAAVDSYILAYSQFEAWSEFTRTPYTRLTAGCAGAQPVISVAANTNWQNADQLVLFHHLYDLTKIEERVISSISSLDVTLTVNVTTARTRDSADTAPFVANLTRPIKISATSQASRGYFEGWDATIVGQRGGYFKFKNVAIWFMGNYQAGNRGAPRIESVQTVASSFQYCVNRGCEQGLLVTSSGAPVSTLTTVVDYHVFYASIYTQFLFDGYIGATDHKLTLTNSLFCGGASAYLAAMLQVCPSGSTISGNYFTMSYDNYIQFNDGYSAVNLSPIEDLTFFCTRASSPCLYFAVNTTDQYGTVYFRRIKAYRLDHTAAASQFLQLPVNVGQLFFEDCEIRSGNSILQTWNLVKASLVRFLRCTLSGESATYQVVHIGFLPGGENTIEFVDCDFSAGNGLTTGLFRYSSPKTQRSTIRLVDCAISTAVFDAALLNSNNWWTYFGPESVLVADRLDNTAGEYRRLQSRTHALANDAVIYKTAAPSERLYPRLQTGYTDHAFFTAKSSSKYIPLTALEATTVSVWVRKSAVGDSGGADYNGAEPKLKMRLLAQTHPNDEVDPVLDTVTAAVGTWELLSASIPAPTLDCVAEVYVEAYGTVGWVSVDDWSTS